MSLLRRAAEEARRKAEAPRVVARAPRPEEVGLPPAGDAEPESEDDGASSASSSSSSSSSTSSSPAAEVEREQAEGQEERPQHESDSDTAAEELWESAVRHLPPAERRKLRARTRRTLGAPLEGLDVQRSMCGGHAGNVLRAERLAIDLELPPKKPAKRPPGRPRKDAAEKEEIELGTRGRLAVSPDGVLFRGPDAFKVSPAEGGRGVRLRQLKLGAAALEAVEEVRSMDNIFLLRGSRSIVIAESLGIGGFSHSVRSVPERGAAEDGCVNALLTRDLPDTCFGCCLSPHARGEFATLHHGGVRVWDDVRDARLAELGIPGLTTGSRQRQRAPPLWRTPSPVGVATWWSHPRQLVAASRDIFVLDTRSPATRHHVLISRSCSGMEVNGLPLFQKVMAVERGRGTEHQLVATASGPVQVMLYDVRKPGQPLMRWPLHHHDGHLRKSSPHVVDTSIGYNDLHVHARGTCSWCVTSCIGGSSATVVSWEQDAPGNALSVRVPPAYVHLCPPEEGRILGGTLAEQGEGEPPLLFLESEFGGLSCWKLRRGPPATAAEGDGRATGVPSAQALVAEHASPHVEAAASQAPVASAGSAAAGPLPPTIDPDGAASPPPEQRATGKRKVKGKAKSKAKSKAKAKAKAKGAAKAKAKAKAEGKAKAKAGAKAKRRDSTVQPLLVGRAELDHGRAGLAWLARNPEKVGRLLELLGLVLPAGRVPGLTVPTIATGLDVQRARFDDLWEGMPAAVKEAQRRIRAEQRELVAQGAGNEEEAAQMAAIMDFAGERDLAEALRAGGKAGLAEKLKELDDDGAQMEAGSESDVARPSGAEEDRAMPDAEAHVADDQQAVLVAAPEAREEGAHVAPAGAEAAVVAQTSALEEGLAAWKGADLVALEAGFFQKPQTLMGVFGPRGGVEAKWAAEPAQVAEDPHPAVGMRSATNKLNKGLVKDWYKTLCNESMLPMSSDIEHFRWNTCLARVLLILGVVLPEDLCFAIEPPAEGRRGPFTLVTLVARVRTQPDDWYPYPWVVAGVRILMRVLCRFGLVGCASPAPITNNSRSRPVVESCQEAYVSVRREPKVPSHMMADHRKKLAKEGKANATMVVSGLREAWEEATENASGCNAVQPPRAPTTTAAVREFEHEFNVELDARGTAIRARLASRSSR